MDLTVHLDATYDFRIENFTWTHANPIPGRYWAIRFNEFYPKINTRIVQGCSGAFVTENLPMRNDVLYKNEKRPRAYEQTYDSYGMSKQLLFVAILEMQKCKNKRVHASKIINFIQTCARADFFVCQIEMIKAVSGKLGKLRKKSKSSLSSNKNIFSVFLLIQSCSQ